MDVTCEPVKCKPLKQLVNGEIDLEFTIKKQTKSLPEIKSLIVSQHLFFPSLVTYKCDLGYVLMASLLYFYYNI